MTRFAQDKEIELYRNLVKLPDEFDEGFGVKLFVATGFMGLIMVPASIYLSLFMGGSIGSAAQWVTIVLFAEVAKRSMTSLRKQEIFILFYMTGIVLSGGGARSLLWYQYLVQSPAAQGLGAAEDIPAWISPAADVLKNSPRTFFTMDWFFPVMLLSWGLIIDRIDLFGLGYALYRLTAHIEKLPFPMAPVGALGMMALVEERGKNEPWRWKCFSIGSMLGLAFGFVYIGVPALTGAVFDNTIQILPIPWLDLTPIASTKHFMPAVPINIMFDLGVVMLGMVIPFWAVVGGAIGLILTWILNPFLYKAGILSTWQPGMGVVDTLYSNTIDFYLSFGIGIAFAIFMASIFMVFLDIMKDRKNKHKKELDSDSQLTQSIGGLLFSRDKKRGDLPIIISLAIYVISTFIFIGVCSWLMPGDENGFGKFPALFFLGFAFLYQPAIGYVNAKLEGMVGQHISIPMVKEAAFIFSGYQGAAIWFAPVPIGDMSGGVRNFRTAELTGVKISGLIKTELIAIPVVIVSGLIFSELIWRMAPIPSESYPYTQEMWDLQARNFFLTVSATMEGGGEFLKAVNFKYISWGLSAGLLSFVLLSFLSLPTFLIYGAVRGLGQTSPGALWLELAGALIGRFYLQKKLGHDKYKKYVIVVFAGFSTGVGLIAMGSVAIALIVKSSSSLGY